MAATTGQAHPQETRQALLQRFQAFALTLPRPLAHLAMHVPTYVGAVGDDRVEGLTPDRVSLLCLLPALLAEAFPADQVEVDTLGYAVFVGSLHAFALDKVIDGQGPDSAALHFLLAECQRELQHTLLKLFPHGTPFWAHYQACYADYYEAELMDVAETGSGHPLDPAAYLRQACAKSAPVRLVVSGLAQLSGRLDMAPPFLASIDRFLIGYQLYDDAVDWQEDHEQGRRTLVTEAIKIRLSETFNEGALLDSDALARQVHGSDLLEKAFESSRDEFARAIEPVSALPCDDWKAFLAGLEQVAHERAQALTLHKLTQVLAMVRP